MEEDLEKRPQKAVVGVPEITAVQGLVPTLQWVYSSSVLVLGELEGLQNVGLKCCI